MADAFMTALLGADSVKASARVKVGSQVRSVTLKKVPTDVSDEAFVEAARHGVDLSVRINSEGDRTRTINGKGVSGAAAVSATSSVLGYTAPAAAAPKPAKSKPTTNGTHPEPAAVSGGMTDTGGSRI
jgi:hypothetical protein